METIKVSNVLLIVLLTLFIDILDCAKTKNVTQHTKRLNVTNKTPTADPKKLDDRKQEKRPKIQQKPIIFNIPHIHIKKEKIKIIEPESIIQWAKEISDNLIANEELVTQRKELLASLSDIKIVERNGTAIVEQMANDLEDLLIRRAKAAEAIMHKAEALFSKDIVPPPGYTYDYSVDIDKLKKVIEPESEWDLPESCRSLQRVPVTHSAHFDGEVNLDISSVHVSPEVFECSPSVVSSLYWSEGLLATFKENYARDASMDFQYFCSAKGFLRTYPATLWSSMFQLSLEVDDMYDCRLRPWYVSASGAARDVLVLLDATGSMDNSSNQVIAEQFTLAMLSALTDDDQVNVLRFNVTVKSPISCFDNKLVSANHVNSAAMMAELKEQPMENKTDMAAVLRYAVRMLQRRRAAPDRPAACQQAIVLVTDSLSYNFTELLHDLDPSGKIRLFVMWLHDPFGLRDSTREYGQWISCDRDGYFAELVTDSDVTEQVMRILRVLERSLVGQRKERLRVFSDMFAHIEDPRRGEYYWRQKENVEQVYRYRELRRNKDKLLNDTFLHHMHQESLDKFGFYYEGEDRNYRLQVSVSVPVFESTTVENITIELDEEDPRNATRTFPWKKCSNCSNIQQHCHKDNRQRMEMYVDSLFHSLSMQKSLTDLSKIYGINSYFRKYPVNRLLGVAGVDIPIDHLKLVLPYYQLGAGGSLFLIDHRGNIVLHDNIKPVFDGDILKPGYRTVDFIDLEQSAVRHEARNYPHEWLEFRKSVLIHQTRGTKTMFGKNVYEYGLRASLEQREYNWRRVVDHYTAVVVLPPYNRRRAVPASSFTQQLAADALKTLSHSDFTVQPDWLYCRHVEPYFDVRESEVLHFIRRRSDEPNFAMKKLKHLYSVIPPALLDKTYQCNEELMARLCKEAAATSGWVRDHEELECASCTLGSVTAFFAGESGLTRWQQYRVTSPHAAPPAGGAWPRGPAEPWYRRAAAARGDLAVHAPVTPVRRMRNTDAAPPPIGPRGEWLTAARVLDHPDKGVLGVAGFHFHPQHLEDLLVSVTDNDCDDEDSECKPSCDGVEWACLLVDEGGWVVAGGGGADEGGTVHLAEAHPAAMAALLDARVFTLHWLYDYQAVCFTTDHKSSAAMMVPSLLRAVWRTTYFMVQVAQQVATLITVLSSVTLVSGDTQKERDKRHNRIRKDFEREKYERLFDERVLVNRSRFAACDRSRPVYELQRTSAAMTALARAAAPCSWPLTGAPVPRTNLLLLAVYTRCGPARRPPPPPHNYPVNVTKLLASKKLGWGPMSAASELACWRNIDPLPTRPRDARCFPHNYTYEEGYRQCGPWLPDPEKKENSGQNTHKSHWKVIMIIFSMLFIKCLKMCMTNLRA